MSNQSGSPAFLIDLDGIGRYGNTSPASLLIATTEWWRGVAHPLREPIVLAAFGAGLNWGAVLAKPTAG